MDSLATDVPAQVLCLDAVCCTWDRVTGEELSNHHSFLVESAHLAAGRPVTDGGEFAVMDDSFPLLGQLEVDCFLFFLFHLRFPLSSHTSGFVETFAECHIFTVGVKFGGAKRDESWLMKARLSFDPSAPKGESS